MIKWKMNENVVIDLPRAEVEALDNFFKNGWLSFFIDKEGEQFIRKRFIEDLAANKRNMVEIKEEVKDEHQDNEQR